MRCDIVSDNEVNWIYNERHDENEQDATHYRALFSINIIVLEKSSDSNILSKDIGPLCYGVEQACVL